MLKILPISVIVLYCLFTMFVYYQQLHVKNFQGASQGAAMLLSLSAFAGMITGFIFLIWYGFYVAWWAPIVLFVIGVLFQFVANFIEALVGRFTLSLGGLIGWPLCAFFMFKLAPAA